MLNTLPMVANRSRKKTVESELEANSDLRRLVHIIVTQFNGDTSAYFDSLRRNTSQEEKESEKREAHIARRFTKSI